MEHLYKTEADPDVKERLLLVLKVEGDEMIPACIAKELQTGLLGTKRRCRGTQRQT